MNYLLVWSIVQSLKSDLFVSGCVDLVPEERPERDQSDRLPDMPHAPASNSRIGLLGLLAALAVMAQLAAVLPRGAQGCFITNCPAGGRKRNALARSVGKRSGGLQQPVREVSENLSFFLCHLFEKPREGTILI